MASISKVVKITVSLLTAAIKEAGFGIPLILDYNTRFSERIRFYSDQSGMLTDGFTTADAAYLAVGAAFAQQPAPPEVAVGRRANMPTLQTKLFITAINLKKYEVTVTKPDGTTSVVSFTSDGTATVLEVVTGLAAAIDALAGVAAVAADANTSVAITAETPGQWFAVKVTDDGVAAGHAGINIQQTHADPGIAADVAAIRLVDDSWYGLTCTSEGKAELEALSAWAESNEKQMIQATQDGTIIDATAGNVALLAQTANRFRTGYIYHENPAQFAGAAWMGSVYPIDPGGITYAFRQLRSVDKSPLSTTHMTNLDNANCNYFIDIGGVGVTFGKDGGGKCASGEWLDVIRDTDWYEVQLGVEILKVKLANNKVPMTNAGITMEEAGLRAATKRAEDAGFLDPANTVYIIPDITAISANNRAKRTLDKFKVNARVQGAIHITDITATITA